jgi:hypothetical protein
MEFNGEEFNKQRYEEIKKQNEYIELNILIGTQSDTFMGKEGKLPVVTTVLQNCGAEEIACMYKTLQSVIGQFEKIFPTECLLGELMMNSYDLGSTLNKKHEEKE